MRIAYLVNHLGQTGVNNVVTDLVKVMTAHGHECAVFYLEETENETHFDCETRRLSSLTKREDFSAFDVVHTHGLKPNLYVLLHKSFEGKTKYVATLHCYVFQDFFDLYGRIKGFLLGVLFLLSVVRHDDIITLSKDAMDYYKRWLPKRKLRYAYNTRMMETEDLTADEQSEITRFKGNAVLIGMNCVLLFRKGIDIMLKALAQLPDNYKLFVVGTGKDEPVFKKQVENLHLENRVCFSGFRRDAYRYLPHYDIYALPSRSEGFPLSLLEAAVYGKEVVCSDLPIIRECFDDDELSMFHLPDDKALAAAIKNVENGAGKGERLRERYLRDYSPECFYRRHIEIYNHE